MKKTLLAALAACAALRLGAGTPWLVLNEDNDHYFKQDSSLMTEAALEAYVDAFARGKVTHFFMCPNGQRTSYDSKVWEPVWAGLSDPDMHGKTNNVWCVNAKLLRDRGIDPYAVWIRRCREKGVSPWLTMRMNDVHFVSITNYFRNMTFWRTHPELWRCPDYFATRKGDWERAAFDYAHREVRDYHLALVRELLERYDPDGFELDWMRFARHLRPGREKEDAHFLTDFIRDARKLTRAAAARRGHPVRLGVRVPALPSVAAALGYDVETWAGEGLVDLVVVSSFLLADESIPYADWAERIRRRAPGVVVLPALDRLLAGGRRCPSYDTDMEISRAWAANMVAEGAPGAYLFNFPYLNSDECPEVAWRRMPERIYAEGLLPGEVVRGARRYALAYHDCTAGGIPDGAQLPVPSGTGTNLFVRIAHNPAPGETVGVTLLLRGASAACRPAVTLNGVAAKGVEPVPAFVKRFSRAGDASALSYRFAAGDVRTGVNMIGVGAFSSGEVVWCDVFIRP